MESDNPRSDRESSKSVSVRNIPMRMFDKDTYAKRRQINLIENDLLVLDYDGGVTLDAIKLLAAA